MKKFLDAFSRPHLWSLPTDKGLFSFSSQEVVSRSWRVVRDADYGGLSSAKLDALQEPATGNRSAAENVSFGRFHGSLVPTIPTQRMVQSGFAAIHSVDNEFDLSDFEGIGLSLRVETVPTGSFWVNLTAENMVGSDLFQALVVVRRKDDVIALFSERLLPVANDVLSGMQTGSGPLKKPALEVAETQRDSADESSFRTLLIPFSRFKLTWKGTLQDQQQLLNSARIKNVGISVSAEKEGTNRTRAVDDQPQIFSMDIQSLFAYRRDGR